MIEDMFESPPVPPNPEDPEDRCAVRLTDGSPCGSPVAELPFGGVCVQHAAAISDWVGGEFGIVDLMPGGCRACGSRLGVRYPSGWACAACEWVLGDVPDPGLPAPRVDVVYYIRFRDRIKIGTTANPRQRLGRLWHEELLAFERGDRLLEHRRHEQFAAARLDRSEWFAVSDDLLQHVDRLAAGVDDPWARYARWLGEAAALRG